MAFAAITLSCTKEQEKPMAPVSEEDGFEIIGVIHNEPESDVKTQYSLDGASLAESTTATFSWTMNDEIKVVVYKSNQTPTHYRLQAKSTSPTSTFKSNGSNGITYDPVGSVVQGGWIDTGFALYPVHDPETVKDSNPVPAGAGLQYGKQSGEGKTNADIAVTLSQAYSLTSLDIDQMSVVPMIGIQRIVNETPSTYYDFYPATGILAFTITNVPVSATAVQLTSFDDDEPLSGTFNLVKGSPAIAMENVVTPSRTRSVNLPERDAEEDITVYIPLPVGTISNGLRIELLDGTANPIFRKKYSSALTIRRGQILRVNLDAPSWKRLGKGQFIDNQLWWRMIYNGEADADSMGYVDVVIEQNVNNLNQYRLVNPYKAAKDQYGFAVGGTPDTPSDYFTFTVAGTAAGSAVTAYDLHSTGITDGQFYYNVQIVYPTDYDPSYSTALNMVLAEGDRDCPAVVQLAPVYQYKENTAVKYDCTGKSDMIHIIFPCAVSDYQPVIDNIGSRSDEMLSNFSLVVSGSRTRLVLARENAIKLAYDDHILNYGQDKSNFTEDQNSIKWNASFNASGKWYLSWFVLESSGKNCFRQGSIPFNVLTAADKAKIASTFLRDISVSAVSAASLDADLNRLGGSTLVIEPSDDVSKGNIMITGFAGHTYDAAGVLDGSGITQGKPLYGNFDGTNAVFPANMTSDNAFYYENSAPRFVSPCSDKTDSQISLTYSEGSVTAGHRFLGLSKANWIGNNGGGYVIYYDGATDAARYSAHKTMGQIDLSGKIEVSSTHASEGSVDYLYDKNASTYWHSNYAGTHALDEVYGIYMDIDLGESKTVSDFSLKFLTRSNIDHGLPTKYVIYGYNSSTESWDELVAETSITASSGTWFQQRVSSENSYRKIRFSVTESNGDRNGSLKIPSAEQFYGYTHLAEMQLWEN